MRYESRTGEIAGRLRDANEASVDLLTDVVSSDPPATKVHVFVDNLSAHKTKTIDAFLVADPRVHLHFTPAYSSWLNEVELWFNKICAFLRG